MDAVQRNEMPRREVSLLGADWLNEV
jgi:hypothetical protein